MAFSATDAGLEGFRLTRENPRAFARWVFFSFAASILGAVVTVAMPAEVRRAVETLAAEETPDLATLGQALVAATPLMVLGLAIQCMMAAAVYRIILRHDDAKYGYLRLGMDELRLMVMTPLWAMLLILIWVGLNIAVGLAMFLAGLAGQIAMVVVGVVAELAAFGAIVYFAVRLSLAPVVTFAERRLVVFGSWRLTRGYFWPLFGAYLLAITCSVVVVLLTLAVFVGVAGAIIIAMGGEFADLKVFLAPDQSSLMAYLHPTTIAYTVVGSALSALWWAVIAAPGAVAYQELHGPVTPPAPKGG